MDPSERRRLSKLMSLVLRHRPQELGLSLDERGFCPVDALVQAAGRALGLVVTRSDVEALAGPPASPRHKVRFELEGDFVRAGHGHSIPIAGYRPTTPRAPLYHATVRAALPAIRAEGLRAMSRQKVHLATDRAITLEAARRRGPDTVLIELDLEAALHAGVGFYESADPRIVLSDDLPPQALRILES